MLLRQEDGVDDVPVIMEVAALAVLECGVGNRVLKSVLYCGCILGPGVIQLRTTGQ